MGTPWCASSGPKPQSPALGRHITWDPDAGRVIEADDLENFDAVVHLAGESIVGRWTPAKKARILESRVRGTLLLCEALAHLRSRPMVLVSASAIGYYGNRGDQMLNEESSAGIVISFGGRVKAWECGHRARRKATAFAS